MDPDYIETAVAVMRGRGIEFASGLTDAEIEAAEAAHAFRFPPDLRDLLSHALPYGKNFPNWRDPTGEFILDRLSWPAESICFDIEHNAFWLDAWGPRPDGLEAAKTMAREALRAAPFLIPVFGHRYLPANPSQAGNPVFSVYQTDVIYYGLDLPSYLFAEFDVPNPYQVPDAPREITFWGELERLNG